MKKLLSIKEANSQRFIFQTVDFNLLGVDQLTIVLKWDNLKHLKDAIEDELKRAPICPSCGQPVNDFGR